MEEIVRQVGYLPELYISCCLDLLEQQFITCYVT